MFQSGTTAEATAAFADMNWAESRYYGMNVAALQNAEGAFVQPTATSLEAGLNDATKNADGSFTMVNSTTDAAAYPMTSVVYAVVPTAPMASADAAAVTELLTQLLNMTGAGGSANSTLPDGFVPLTSAVTAQATADIAKDITVIPPVTVPPTTTTTTPATTPTTAPSGGGSTDNGSGSSDLSVVGNTGNTGNTGVPDYGQPIAAADGLGSAAANAITAANSGPLGAGSGHRGTLPCSVRSCPGSRWWPAMDGCSCPRPWPSGSPRCSSEAALMTIGIMRRRRSLLGAAAAAGVEGALEPEQRPEPQ